MKLTEKPTTVKELAKKFKKSEATVRRWLEEEMRKDNLFSWIRVTLVRVGERGPPSEAYYIVRGY